MGVAEADQTALDEQVVENEVLEGALRARQQKNEDKLIAQKAFKEADASAKAQLEELDLEEGAVVRVGDFRIEVVPTKARSVSFDTAPGSRLKIQKVEE